MSLLRLHKGILIDCLDLGGSVIIGSGYAWTKYKAILIFRFVDQCVFGHDKNRRVERFYVGQNYAVLWGSIMKNGKRVSLKNMDIGESGAAMTQNWYDEVSNMAKIFRHPSKIIIQNNCIPEHCIFIFLGKRCG